ncbi:excisionase family protein [Buttiauxella noackiae]|uniref:excisionase family protein n=1 Tax=Buttiauxella noackiae TaxID=82992 RepID=UPI002354900D|nr:excisionase family protein [Buttiauxella noackiae]MCA1920961.1 excisionase family protein [Buttiauxella noackiae]
MAQVIFNEEWVVATKLTDKTGLTKRQIKALRDGVWVEGIHFKRLSVTGGETQRGLLWYNIPLINQLIKEL